VGKIYKEMGGCGYWRGGLDPSPTVCNQPVGTPWCSFYRSWRRWVRYTRRLVGADTGGGGLDPSPTVCNQPVGTPWCSIYRSWRGWVGYKKRWVRGEG